MVESEGNCTQRGTVHRGETQRGTVHRGELYTEGNSTQRGAVHRGELYTEGNCTQRGTVHRGETEGNCTQRGTVHRGETQRGTVQRGTVQRGTVHRGELYTEGNCTQRGTVHRGELYTEGNCTHRGAVHIWSILSGWGHCRRGGCCTNAGFGEEKCRQPPIWRRLAFLDLTGNYGRSLKSLTIKSSNQVPIKGWLWCQQSTLSTFQLVFIRLGPDIVTVAFYYAER